MKRKAKIRALFAALLMTLVLLAGCSSQTQSAVTEQNSNDLAKTNQFESVRQVVAEYLSSEPTSMDPDQLYQIIQDKNPEYLLVDIRANKDFVANNIPGSVSIPYAQTSTHEKLEALPQDKTLVIIDYNGHLAAQTSATWNQLGYKSIPLYYGIQSWTQANSARGYDPFPITPLNYPLVAQEETKTLKDNPLPELIYPEGKTKEYILDTTRIYAERSYRGIIEAEDLARELKQNTDKYFLVDIRLPNHYQQGHIEGSINIPLAQLAEPEMLKKLPTSKRIVLIGYDGMDASFGSRSLVTLGYDSVALKYGLSYWNPDEKVTGIAPIHNLVKEHYPLEPLNYQEPSSAPASCS